MSKIYKIFNDINDKVYIGKTNLSIEERFAIHCKDMLKREEEKRPLYNAMRKYGIEHFFIEEVEDCLPSEASDKEIYWIGYYRSYSEGYNATRGGDGKNLYDHEAILARLKEHPYPKDIAKEFGCCVDIVRDIAKHNQIMVQSKGQENLPQAKIVLQFTKDGQFVQSFPSTVAAAEWLFQTGCCINLNGGVRGHISECARGQRKTAYGYIWKYS